ncbi:MAG TPA: glycerol-3-phosphate 1-O-acyltransferase PlsY [Clostridia bacterium]|nr:glycerol-3-phosphate 1-O-acyltransferase PlsY [Clostridia bacterium]
MLTYVVVAIAAYLLGSIPFGYILVRTFVGADVRAQGSGNIGATNVARTGHKGLAIATLLLDALKGAFAVLFAFAWGRHTLTIPQREAWYAGEMVEYLQHTVPYVEVSRHLYALAAVAALFAIIGHMYPVWLRFKGGKGVATGLGVFVAIAPKAVLVVMIVFALILVVARYVSLGSIVAAALFPVAFFLLQREQASPLVLAITAGVSLLIIWKHRANIQRLLAGTEHRFGSKK